MAKRRRGGKSKSETKPESKEEKPEEKEEEKPEEKEEEPPEPSTPEPENTEEEDAEATAALEKLLATPTTPKCIPLMMTPLTPTTAGLQVARTRLTGLLHRVSKTAADDSDSSQDEQPLSAAAAARPVSPVEPVKRAPSPVVKVKTEASSTPKVSSAKRRKKREGGVVIDSASASAFHHTYVMKLFDRSVDLAQFNESTSLYPVCRAWMANQPRNPNLSTRHQTPSPTLSEEEEDENKSDKEENSKDSNDEEETIKPVHKLPPPSYFADPTEPMRVPSPIPHVVEPVIINEEANIEGGKDERALLAEHVGHWRAVKTKWMQAGHSNEDRYRESIDIIEDIYKKAQEMYA